VVNPKPHPELVMVELFEDAVDFFLLRQSGVPRDMKAALARIEEGPLVHAARVTESRELLARLDALGCAPRRVIACGDFELVKSIALAGVGVGVMPRRVAAYGQPGKLARVHPELPCFEDRICLVYRADLHKTKAAVRLKEELLAHGRRLREI
jgi:DNA-binding transcriptional LysR family regulator